MSENRMETVFEKTLLGLFEETFEGVQGAYLDKGTSFFETLASISAEQASQPLADGGSTIAAHTGHARFYLDVIEKAWNGTLEGKVDWGSSWKVKTVTEDEWKVLITDLRKSRDNLLEQVKSVSNWGEGDSVQYALGAVVHTAYHLGAVRQFLTVVDR